MENIKKIYFDLDYILSIYDDIEKTYNDIEDKNNIVKIYNMDDLKLLIKIYKTFISVISSDIYAYEINMEMYFNNTINNYYNYNDSLTSYDFIIKTLKFIFNPPIWIKYKKISFKNKLLSISYEFNKHFELLKNKGINVI